MGRPSLVGRLDIWHKRALEDAFTLAYTSTLMRGGDVTGIHDVSKGRESPSKCPSCGSHEFRKHQGRTICGYCRSGHGVQAAPLASMDDHSYAKMTRAQRDQFLSNEA